MTWSVIHSNVLAVSMHILRTPFAAPTTTTTTTAFIIIIIIIIIILRRA